MNKILTLLVVFCFNTIMLNAQDAIIHDAEYYVIESQNGEGNKISIGIYPSLEWVIDRLSVIIQPVWENAADLCAAIRLSGLKTSGRTGTCVCTTAPRKVTCLKKLSKSIALPSKN